MPDYYSTQKIYDATTGTSYDITGYATGPNTEAFGVWGIVALIIAIVGGILLYFLFVKSKNSPKSKFAKWLKDFLAFKIMWIEPILKVAYYIATIFIVLSSFSFLSLGANGILYFLVMLIGGPIVIRLLYEITMMFIMIWRNTRDIAESKKK